MRYRFELECPVCNKKSETTSDRLQQPRVKCGDCLMERVEVVEMTVLKVTAVEEAR